ncbi:MAG: hypothetical protein ACI85O_002660 [Saprospiraceae bacterium]|jgi:hypothetical protein
MKISTKAILFFLILSFQLSGQPSPFGTGQITNQNIGQLDNASVVVPSESGYGFAGFFPDAQELLEEYNYDIYVPEAYDGSEEYGLVVFINSGNNGGFKGQWLSVLDDKKLIWISGDAIGNSIFINIRMGVGMAAALRMQELFNIDTNRIYTSGNSGGARMAHNLAFIYPETFNGAMPSCGGSYIREVAQDYETQNPDGNYEAILSYPSDYLDYLIPFDQRFANMTSFNDFREGDIMNIYHNGSEQDGLKGKFLETSGGHCSTTTEHFQDAINFVEHPFIEVIQEGFTGSTSDYFSSTNTNLSSNSVIELEHNTSDFAQIQSKNLFLWNDPMGAIFETSIQVAPSIFNMNTSFNLGVWSMENPTNYCDFSGTQIDDEIPAILLSVDFIDAQPSLSVEVKNSSQADTELLFTSTFSDWEIGEPLQIKYHLWDKELRIELGAHLLPPSTTVAGVMLLDDSRSIRIRWNDITNDFWEDATWANGAFLTLASEKNVSSEFASNLFINRVELITADVDIATEIPNTSSDQNVSICDGETYLFNDENLTESGVYTATLSNTLGCDSLINLNLTVNTLPVVEIEEMNGIISTDNSFESFQWYLNDTILNDETESLISPDANGDYYVEVTNENGCIGISNTISIMNTSLKLTSLSEVFIYPNPTTGKLIIDSGNSIFKAEIFDIYGRRVVTNMSLTNDISSLENGMYFLILKREGDTSVFKIQKLD